MRLPSQSVPIAAIAVLVAACGHPGQGTAAARPTPAAGPSSGAPGRPPVRELAGFSFALPTGQVLENTQSYRSGNFSVQPDDARASSISVSWSPGSIQDNELDVTIQQFQAEGLDVSPEHLPGPGGLQVPTVVFHDAAEPQWLSAFECGTRVIYLTTWGAPDAAAGAAAEHRRITGTFDCHPDAAREPALGTIRVALDLPHFFTQPGGRYEGELLLTDGVAINLILVERYPTARLDPRRDIWGLTSVVIEPTVDGRTGFAGIEDGTPVRGFLATVECATFKVTLIAQTKLAQAKRLRSLYEPIAHARCLDAGEAPPTWPDLPAKR